MARDFCLIRFALAPCMIYKLAIAACITLTLVSCTVVPIDHSKVVGPASENAVGTVETTMAVRKKIAKQQAIHTQQSQNQYAKPQDNIEAAWERQMAIISSEGTESYVLDKDAVVDNISDIMRDCSNALEIHGRNGMGKSGCSEFIKYQGRYNDFSALFILTALYQRDFIEKKIESNTVYSQPAENILKQAYAAHQDYEIIVGTP